MHVGSRGKPITREIPRPAGKNAVLRDDAYSKLVLSKSNWPGTGFHPQKSRRLRIGGSMFNSNTFLLRTYFELRFAAFFEGGITPFSGLSFSITSVRWCNGLSFAEENCGPASGTVKP